MNRRRILLAIALVVGTIVLLVATLPQEPTADGKTISQWLETLGDGHSVQRETAAAIEKIGTNALPWMLREIRRGNSPAKLWWQEQAERQSLLKFTFADEDKHREHAVAAFEILGDAAAPAIPALMRLLEKEAVPFEVQEALVHIGEPAVVRLVQALTSPNPALRQNAAEALYWYNPTPPPAVPALFNCLFDSDAGVRAIAARALGGEDEMAGQIVPALIRLLDDSDREVRSEAAGALSFYRDQAEAAVGPLVNLVTNCQSDIQRQAIRALGSIGRRSELVVPMLLTNLQSADTHLRWTVIESLAAFPDHAEEIVPALLSQVEQQPRYEISHAVIGSLGKLRGKPDIVLPYLISCLNDANPYVRWDAVWALRDFGDSSEQTISALKLRLQDDKQFYHGWQKSMLRVSDAAQRVLQALQSKQPQQTVN